MADLTRISISLEVPLLEAFDALIEGKGYATRSEAIRDLIRARLIREEARHQNAEQVAIVTMVYDHHARELASRLVDMQHHHHELVVSTMHVHLGVHHCLEVSILRGPAAGVMHLGDELLATKGVLHGEITLTGAEVFLNHYCPVKSRITTTGYGESRSLFGRFVGKEPEKPRFFQKVPGSKSAKCHSCFGRA
jgi:CopG family transcriptional regulator, nickel-responsive regulator